MKQFDEILRQQIKDAFSRYDAVGLADAGWNAFLQKRKKRGIAGIIIPMWAKAASVAVLITVGSLLTYQLLDTTPDSVSGRPESGTVVEKSPSLRKSTDGSDTPVLSKPAKIVGEIVETPILATKRTDDKMADNYAIIPPEVTPESTERIEVPAVTEPAVEPDEHRGAKSEQLIVSGQPVEDPEYGIEEECTRRTSLLAGLSGMMARAEDLSTGVPGLSFGLYGEHKISRRWAVRPGIVLAMQTFGMGTPAVEKSMNYSAPALNGASGTIESFEGSLHLLAMEVPVNLVYTIIERGKKGLYVSAGASTMVYLNQNVSGSFTNAYTMEIYNSKTGESAFDTRYSSLSVESREEPFSHTDLFGLANFSAGYSMPFTNSSSLLIEPYIQLPLNTLTSLNLRIRYGGVSMKIRFGQTSRKSQNSLTPQEE